MARTPKITPQVPGEQPKADTTETGLAAEEQFAPLEEGEEDALDDGVEAAGAELAADAGSLDLDAPQVPDEGASGADGSSILEITAEDVVVAQRILAAHARGLTFVDLSEPLPEQGEAGSDDPFDEHGIAHAAKGRTPEPHEVDPSRIKRAVLTTRGYAVPEPRLHPAQKY